MRPYTDLEKKTLAVSLELVIPNTLTLKYLKTYLFNGPPFVSGRVVGRVVPNGKRKKRKSSH